MQRGPQSGLNRGDGAVKYTPPLFFTSTLFLLFSVFLGLSGGVGGTNSEWLTRVLCLLQMKQKQVPRHQDLFPPASFDIFFTSAKRKNFL